MTCKDCIHRDVCLENGNIKHETASMKIVCHLFKNKFKLIELPVEIGDKVWFIKSHFQYAKEPMLGVVNMIKTFSSNTDFTFGALMAKSLAQRKFTEKEIGKTVFLTQAAAAQALKELQTQNE